MKYKNFDRETAVLLDHTRQVAAQRALARETLKAEIEAEWERRMESHNIQLATAVWQLMDANAEGKLPLTAIQDAARLRNYDRWKAFLSEYAALRQTIEPVSDVFCVTSITGWLDGLFHPAVKVEFSDGTEFSVEVRLMLTYTPQYPPEEAVIMTPEQADAVRQYVAAGPSATWLVVSGQYGENTLVVGTEDEANAGLAQYSGPVYNSKKVNLHEYISGFLKRQEGK